ncbi:hypothetical protein [Novispirillum itersonii]|uniref:hypothetical protein n=1 Tax=Novispirillum itersonii TaxID=189 RepID=UPI00037BA262|nr:hypothetical protein [Novispirillum itersonii]
MKQYYKFEADDDGIHEIESIFREHNINFIRNKNVMYSWCDDEHVVLAAMYAQDTKQITKEEIELELDPVEYGFYIKCDGVLKLLPCAEPDLSKILTSQLRKKMYTEVKDLPGAWDELWRWLHAAAGWRF